MAAPALPDGPSGTPEGAERMMTVAGHRVRVHVRPARRPAGAASADLRPLVLVNGIGASLELLEPLVDVLDPAREVIRFDVPGIGGSPLPFAPLPMAALAALLSGLVDGLGHRRVDVLGLSWGGGIAQQFALQYPAKVGRLALVSTGMGILMVPARFAVLAKMLTPRRYNDRSYRREAGAEIYVGEDQAKVDQLFLRVHEVSPRGYMFQLLALATWTSLPVLGLIAAPTLVLAGRRDPVIPVVNAQIMGAMIPRSTVHLHAGGHLGLLTRPKELGRVLEDFLDADTR